MDGEVLWFRLDEIAFWLEIVALVPIGLVLRVGLLIWKTDVLALKGECTTPLICTLTMQDVTLILGNVEKIERGVDWKFEVMLQDGLFISPYDF